MLITMLKGKLHNATVTDVNIDYEGSVSIDRDLLDASGILPYEQVHVWDITNGARFITYAIEAEPGSSTVCVQGAAARLVQKGDRVIIGAFCQMDEAEAKIYQPKTVILEKGNKVKV
jgi:aspartate 1-decarboxylase